MANSSLTEKPNLLKERLLGWLIELKTYAKEYPWLGAFSSFVGLWLIFPVACYLLFVVVIVGMALFIASVFLVGGGENDDLFRNCSWFSCDEYFGVEWNCLWWLLCCSQRNWKIKKWIIS